MFCPNCGNLINEGSKFCSNCGWSGKGNKLKNEQKAKFPKQIIKLLLGVIGILVIALIIYNVPKPNGKVYEFSEIKKAKTVTRYWKNSLVDNFDTVKFGSYPQSDSEGNSKEPIEWLVLDRQGNKVLLFTKYILDHRLYSYNEGDEGERVTWETCNLRSWLNNSFYNIAFNNNEKNYIQTINVINSDNNTNDKVFLLSIDEIKKYFYPLNRDNKRLATRGTEYAKRLLWFDENGYNGFSTLHGWAGNRYLFEELCDYGNSSFWLRSHSINIKYQRDAEIVNETGYPSDYYMDNFDIGVRPALWVDISSLNTKNNVSNGWDGDYYYIDGKKIINDWIQYNNKWYYLDTDGKYVRGDWKQVGNDWYYFDSNGGMLSNEWVDGKYYVDSNGKMLKDTITPDGYYVNANGEYNENSMHSYVPQQSGLTQNQSTNIANGVLLNQIQKAKLVTQYASDTTVDQMDTVTFGSYYQSNSNTKEPIDWIVLDRQEDKALLLSKYILDCKCYNEEYKELTWETCNLRSWLNNSFYNTAFNSNEKNYIHTTNVINSDNVEDDTKGGNNTNDKVFLLSIDEVKKYFFYSYAFDDRLATRGTNYAKDNGENNLWVFTYNGNSYYWLRSPGSYQGYALGVDSGMLYSGGFYVDKHNIGVRPAIWVKY